MHGFPWMWVLFGMFCWLFFIRPAASERVRGGGPAARGMTQSSDLGGPWVAQVSGARSESETR